MWSILWDAKDSPALCALDISSDLGAAIQGQGAHTSCETQEWIEGTRTDKKCCTESSKKDGTCSPYHYFSRIWSFYLFWAWYWHLRPFKIPGAVTSMGAHWLRGLPQTAACQKSPQMCQLLTTGQERQQADHGCIMLRIFTGYNLIHPETQARTQKNGRAKQENHLPYISKSMLWVGLQGRGFHPQ